MPVTWQWTLPEGTQGVAMARREIRAAAGERPDVEDVVLVASELCTNALVHGSPPVRLRAVIDGQTMRIEVENRRDGEGMNVGGQRRMPGTNAIGGRGLAMVQALAEDWGAKEIDGLTCVWAELRSPGWDASGQPLDPITE